MKYIRKDEKIMIDKQINKEKIKIVDFLKKIIKI